MLHYEIFDQKGLISCYIKLENGSDVTFNKWQVSVYESNLNSEHSACKY